MKEKTVKINKTKSWFFEKINKIDKTLARLNMPEDLENSAVATGLEKISFHSNPKEMLCQRMLKLTYNCAHFTCQQSNAQNPSS